MSYLFKLTSTLTFIIFKACLDHIFDAKIASCLVNPRAVHETTLIIKPGESLSNKCTLK